MWHRTCPVFPCSKFMNLQELKEWIKRRLTRKARQAERAFISEFTVKCTTNCLNHGIQLGDGVWHCKINAMGLHEQGASQCWNHKARVCPLFELSRDVETLKSDFRRIGPNELSIRWPSLGELIRFDHVLSLVEESKVETHVESSLHQSGNQLPSSGDEEGTGFDDGDVRGEHISGRGDSTPSNQTGINSGGESDSRSSISGASYSQGLPLAIMGGSRDRSGADREAV
jgi:hypothetical protein